MARVSKCSHTFQSSDSGFIVLYGARVGCVRQGKVELVTPVADGPQHPVTRQLLPLIGTDGEVTIEPDADIARTKEEN